MKNQNASGLNDKQEKFCREFVVNFNATEAAINAGYSKKTATVQGSQLLTLLKVQEFIKSLQKKVADKLEITAERVVEEYAKIGFSNIADLMKEGMTFEDIKNLDPKISATIESVSVTETFDKQGNRSINTKIKLHSKPAALDALGKHTGIYKEDNKQKSDLFKAFLGIDTDKV